MGGESGAGQKRDTAGAENLAREQQSSHNLEDD